MRLYHGGTDTLSKLLIWCTDDIEYARTFTHTSPGLYLVEVKRDAIIRDSTGGWNDGNWDPDEATNPGEYLIARRGIRVIERVE